MTVRVRVWDDEADDEPEEAVVPEGDYFLIATDPCTYGVQAYANGTHVITVKGRIRAHEANTGTEGEG